LGRLPKVSRRKGGTNSPVNTQAAHTNNSQTKTKSQHPSYGVWPAFDGKVSAPNQGRTMAAKTSPAWSASKNTSPY